MRRRRFIKAAAAATILSIVGVTAWPEFSSVAKKMLLEATKQLKVDEDVIDRFISDATREKYWQNFSSVKQEFIKISTILANPFITVPYSNKFEQYRDQIVGQFLLSTDYFFHKMDNDKNVTYVSFYNPYKKPCSNPFSSLYYPS